VIRFATLAFLVFMSSHSMASTNEAWVWPTAYKSKKIDASTVYLLQHHLPKTGKPRKMGPWPWAWNEKILHIVIRSDREPSADEVVGLYLQTSRKWRDRGVTVAGLQLDYDSPTSKLAGYFAKVREIRNKLPSADGLSITGLADWTSLATFGDLLKSREITVFFQMYRERWEHEGTPLYLERLKSVSFPFKIGLLPEQKIALVDSEALAKNDWFKGFVHFHGGPR
jgi:hypothetical protein